MIWIQLITCAGMITGFFLLLQLSPIEFTDGLFGFLQGRPKSIREEINEATKRKKPSFFRREILEARDILDMTGKSSRFPTTCACSLLLFAIGASFAIVMGNFFLAPVMAVGLLLFPFWYIRLTASHFKKDIAAGLETALSVITTAYLRNEDILTAVEENLHYLNPPVQSVFRDFLMQVKMVNPDVDAALKKLRAGIDNEVFREWCDAVADCRYDRSLKTILTPIVSKLSDVRIVNGELDNLVAEPRKEFIIMVVLVISNIPLMYVLNRDWYDILMHTVPGQVILAVTAALIFLSTALVIRLTKPIEYRR